MRTFFLIICFASNIFASKAKYAKNNKQIVKIKNNKIDLVDATNCYLNFLKNGQNKNNDGSISFLKKKEQNVIEDFGSCFTKIAKKDLNKIIQCHSNFENDGILKNIKLTDPYKIIGGKFLMCLENSLYNKIEITANGVAALISCHLNFLKEGTLQNIKERKFLKKEPYIRIGESIQSCLYMMSENDSVINNDMDKLNATFYLNITKEFEKSQELNELLLSNDKINLMYYGWIIQMLYYIVADNLLGKLLDSNDFELVYILSNKDLDKNRYKDFLKKHLKRIIENFDILLEKHDKNIYKDFKNIKYSLEKKLEDFEVKIYKDDFKKHYLWLKLKSNSKQALFVTPRSSTTSFPKSPKDGKDAEETHSNISKKPKFEDVLSNMSASPIVKRVLYLVNGEIEGEKSEKNKTTENLENLFKSIAITHIFTSRDTSDIANILLGVNIKGKKIEESHFLHTDAKKSFSEIINKCNEKNGYKVEKNSYIKRLTNKWKKLSRIKFIEMADKDDTVKIVIVADRNTIGVIHQLITGQWVAAEPGSVSKFVEFEFAQNDEQPEGEPTYKNFRLVRSNDVNHLEKYRRVDPSDGFTLTLKK